MASTSKHVNKLEVEVSKKQERIDDYLVTQIYLAKKTLQSYLDEVEKEEKEIADIKKQQEDLINHKPGQLAKVSVYEFVNDWLRPELAWHIFSYVADDPHKKGIKKAQTHRQKWGSHYAKKMWNGRPCWTGKWEHYRYDERDTWSYSNKEPYCLLRLYKEIHTDVNATCCAYPGRYGMGNWVNRYEIKSGSSLMTEKLKNTNQILYDLWKIHDYKHVGRDGNTKFVIAKKDIVKLLKEWKVPGRTDLTYGVKCSEATGTDYIQVGYGPHHLYKPPESRRELVGALMRFE